jgi:hypothetical protein
VTATTAAVPTVAIIAPMSPAIVNIDINASTASPGIISRSIAIITINGALRRLIIIRIHAG